MRKVLIIDGDREFLEMAVSFLLASNFMAATADNIEQAREQIAEFNPDLVLLDRDLLSSSGRLIPDGFDILRELKTHQEWKKIPVILLINEASGQDLENLRLLKYKAEDYASKPIADNDLLRRIENLIGFDPEETNSVFMKEKNSVAGEQNPGENPELAEAAHREIEELLTRLGEEIIQNKKGQEPAKTGAFKDHLRAEFDLLSEKLDEQDVRYHRTREKSRKAIEVLEQRIRNLETDRRDLEAKAYAAEAEVKRVIGERQDMLLLLEKARELTARFLGLKKELENNGETAQQFLAELEQFKK